jgi:hypothetical protein
VIDALRLSTGGDSEVYPGVFEHPLGIVRLLDSGRCRKQGRVEVDGFVEVIDAYVNVESFHAVLRDLRGTFDPATGLQAGAQESTPPQQFLVK